MGQLRTGHRAYAILGSRELQCDVAKDMTHAYWRRYRIETLRREWPSTSVVWVLRSHEERCKSVRK